MSSWEKALHLVEAHVASVDLDDTEIESLLNVIPEKEAQVGSPVFKARNKLVKALYDVGGGFQRKIGFQPPGSK